MKITSITTQRNDNNRVNISIDGKYSFSLYSFQLVDLGVKVGREYDEQELKLLEKESQFGKIYNRALKYCLIRLHSTFEVRNYLYKKTKPTLNRKGQMIPGIESDMVQLVLNRLQEKGYLDDEKFTDYWIENRALNRGVSRRKLIFELKNKGVSSEIINKVIDKTWRNNKDEINKVILKKRCKYIDEKKFISYLLRLGFEYDEIKVALLENND